MLDFESLSLASYESRIRLLSSAKYKYHCQVKHPCGLKVIPLQCSLLWSICSENIHSLWLALHCQATALQAFVHHFDYSLHVRFDEHLKDQIIKSY